MNPDEALFDSREANPQVLLRSVARALEVLSVGGDQVAALEESFGLAMQGLRADKGLLLYVRRRDPVELEIIEAQGLSYEQQEACRRMESVAEEGVSPTVIREAITDGRPVYIPNSADVSDKWRTTSFAGVKAHSVLCAPVHDPATGAPIAALYFQTKGVLNAFETSDLAWLTGFAAALSQGFGLHLARRREVQELRAPDVIGASAWREEVLGQLNELLQRRPRLVVVCGPAGAGKVLMARYLHYYSRHAEPFVVYDCKDPASAGRDLLGGGSDGRPGLVRAAQAGVLVLKAADRLPPEAQVALSELLREGLPGGIKLEAEIVLSCASAARLAPEMRAHLEGEPGAMIQVLPLSDPRRRDDIRPLLAHYVETHERALHKKLAGITAEAWGAFAAYDWPGNVRELDAVSGALVTGVAAGGRVALEDVRAHCPQVLG